MRFDPISFLKRHEPKALGHKISQQKFFWTFFIESLHMPITFKAKAIGLCKFVT
jgi:hypothetical protein